ncbi:MAG: bifunctional YncE family protein/alkaline phosphatase family protein [Gemmatales bacterium]|nr:bifunctional YncE family protein/alkaline phosphatase family protein [Gemmatales bacterium]MDW8387333.1 bifunctional YncE family protein/alkaline phosphatase family protein [Gemmatales bacterium]
MKRSTLAIGLAVLGFVLTAWSQEGRVLPGPRPDGRIQLPNQWSLRPAGRQIEVGDFPVNMALHPQGKFLAVLHAGYGEHEVMIIDLTKQRIASRVPVEQTFYGLCFSPDGKHVYASGAEFEIVHQFEFEDGLLGRRRTIRIAEEKSKFIPGGIAVSSDGKTLFVCGTWGSGVCVVPLDKPEDRWTVQLEAESYPYTCLPDKEGKRLFISLWSKASVAVLDLTERKVTAQWPTERHPTEMALTPDGKTLYVACANSTKVSVLDAGDGKALQTIACSLYPAAPTGNTPNSLSLTPDGQILLVANADANNLSLFDVQDRLRAKPLGFIPVGWYPTSVRYHAADKRIYVANGKGTLPKANRQGPDPTATVRTLREYIGTLYRGTVSVIDMPTPEQMVKYSQQAFECSPLRADLAPVGTRSPDNPIPAKVGEPCPIKYCIYIIKENRTYDQVFGDLPEGNGDPSLCIFPERVTPNHHKLAREFVLLDNFYVESEVSADGHEWSMGAYCTDFVEKVWPLNYRGSPLRKLTQYPAEGEKDAVARPAGGYIWDRCAEAGVSYFSFGEWIANGPTPNDPGRARVKALEGHFDPWFRGYDLDYPDVKRAERFITVLKQWEKEGKMPQLVILRLPNDHTAGTRVGKPTPTAMVADNDLALGMVVEAISKSKFWKESAIFVVEDDAQNGPDHVDAHRTVAFVISPYVKRKSVDSTMYSTASMLRTMELILGLKPMSQFDAAARPMYNSFTAKPDFTPYEHLPANVDLTETNKATAWGAKLSEQLDLSKEDAADDLLFNEIIWRSVRGPHSPMPPPVRAAFVFPHLDD